VKSWAVKKVKTTKHSNVKLIFMEKFWQEWAFHLPLVLMKNCVQQHIKALLKDLQCGVVVKIDNLMWNLI